MTVQTVKIPYKPRAPFLKFHNRVQRFAVLVCHRRAGKTVCTINDIIARAIHTPRNDGFYGYVCPTFTQAKAVAWSYLKKGVAVIPNVKINETQCSVVLPNGSTIRLFGADNPDSLRGLYFDGVVLDEFGDMQGRVYTEVVRPAVSDRLGWVVFIGTPRGKNSFWEKLQQAQKNPKKWFLMVLKASESGLLPQSEIDDMKEEMDEDEVAAELECSFEAAIKGAYYGKRMSELAEKNQITNVPHIMGVPVETAWDLGRTDALAVWFYQIYAGQIRVINYYETSQMEIGEVLEDIDEIVTKEQYDLATAWVPQDARAKQLGTKKSVIEQMLAAGLEARIVPHLERRDGINAARYTLQFCYFDANNCAVGLERLRNYQRTYDPDRKVYSNTPLHDINSNGADAFRYLSCAVKDSDLAQSLKKNRPKLSPAEAKQEWESKGKVNTRTELPAYTLDDLWSTARVTSGGYIQI
jgi:hypothetical protein